MLLRDSAPVSQRRCRPLPLTSSLTGALRPGQSGRVAARGWFCRPRTGSPMSRIGLRWQWRPTVAWSGRSRLDRAAVAVGAHNRLLRSPLLIWTGGVNWVPAELPDSVANARAAVSICGRSETAVTAGGTVLTRTATGWSTVVDLRQLAPAGGVRIDSIVWGSASLGWLTAHGRAGPADGVSNVRRWRGLDSCAAGHGFRLWLPSLRVEPVPRGCFRSSTLRVPSASCAPATVGSLGRRARPCRSRPASPHGDAWAKRSGPPRTSEALTVSLPPTMPATSGSIGVRLQPD